MLSHGCLLQFTDDTCLICSGDSAGTVAQMLQEDLHVLSQWIMTSKVKLNLNKSSVMWFSIKPPSDDLPPVVHDGIPLSCVDKQKYLSVTFDSRLNWSSHISKIYGSMSYYLTLINSHVKCLPTSIMKMLIESLVFSQYTYALPVWGPAINKDSLS